MFDGKRKPSGVAEMALFITEQRKRQFLYHPAVTLSGSRACLEWPQSPQKFSVQVITWWLFGGVGGQINVHYIADKVWVT